MFAMPMEPRLPSSWVSDDPPFSNSGTYFASPLYTSDNGSKTCICLFTCASTQAVHLELVDSLSVPAFLQAFARFAPQRGLPVQLISDNAKTFKSAAKEEKSIGRSTEVQHFLVNKGIVWDFIIEKAPWKGGFWERMNQLMKRCLRKSLGCTSMNFESLQTLLIEIEATINNRPLTYTHDDEGVLYPLTTWFMKDGSLLNPATGYLKSSALISLNQESSVPQTSFAAVHKFLEKGIPDEFKRNLCISSPTIKENHISGRHCLAKKWGPTTCVLEIG